MNLAGVLHCPRFSMNPNGRLDGVDRVLSRGEEGVEPAGAVAAPAVTQAGQHADEHAHETVRHIWLLSVNARSSWSRSTPQRQQAMGSEYRSQQLGIARDELKKAVKRVGISVGDVLWFSRSGVDAVRLRLRRQ
jgi:hypothetical protein